MGKEALTSTAVSVVVGSGCASSWAAVGSVGRGAEIGVVISTITSGNVTTSTAALGRAMALGLLLGAILGVRCLRFGLLLLVLSGVDELLVALGTVLMGLGSSPACESAAAAS